MLIVKDHCGHWGPYLFQSTSNETSHHLHRCVKLVLANLLVMLIYFYFERFNLWRPLLIIDADFSSQKIISLPFGWCAFIVKDHCGHWGSYLFQSTSNKTSHHLHRCVKLVLANLLVMLIYFYFERFNLWRLLLIIASYF